VPRSIGSEDMEKSLGLHSFLARYSAPNGTSGICFALKLLDPADGAINTVVDHPMVVRPAILSDFA
jgi:hypothetical protein